MPETWQTYRRSLAGALGWHMFETQSSTGSAPAANQVVIQSLIDSNLEANFLDHAWEYQPTGGNAGEVRRTVKGGLASGSGTVTLSRAHTAATTSGATVELYGVLPPTQHLGRRGLLQAANLALQECWALDTLNITAISTAYTYDLSTAYPWLTHEEQVVDVYVRRSGDVHDRLIRNWRWRDDVDTPQIELAALANASDIIKPLVYRPLNTWLKVNSTWTDTATALTNETDQALLSIDGMLAVGLYHCYDFLATEGDASQRAQWRALADRQRIKANRWKAWTLPKQTGRDVHWSIGSESISLIGNGAVFDAGEFDL